MHRPLSGVRRTAAFALSLGLALVLACGGGKDGGTTPGQTILTYRGVFAGENGTEAGNIAASVVVEDSSGSGNFLVNGNAKAFSSISYDGTTMVATGQGFTFTGQVDDTSITGTYTSASGGGLFTALRKTGSATPATFCGTHIGARAGDPIAGPFAFVQNGNTRFGVFTSVLADPFRGSIRGSTTLGPVALDTLTGAAVVAVTGSNFTGSYIMLSGDSGAVEGAACPSAVISPISSALQGVFGSFNGSELGDFSFNLSSTGVGSTGSYKIGAVAKNFITVVSGVQNQVAAFDTNFSVVATINTDTLEGTYSHHGVGQVGKIAGLNLHGDSASTWCGTNSGGGSAAGAFSFLMKSDSTIFGLFTGGTQADPFQGIVTGSAGNDASTMEGLTAPATVLPSVGGFSGVYFTNGGGSGSVNGGLCP